MRERFTGATVGLWLCLLLGTPVGAASTVTVGGATINVVPPVGCVRVDGLDPGYEALTAKLLPSIVLRLAEFWKTADARDLLQSGVWYQKTVFYLMSITKDITGVTIRSADMPAVLSAAKAGLPAAKTISAKRLDDIEKQIDAAIAQQKGTRVQTEFTDFRYLGLLEETKSSFTYAHFVTTRASRTDEDIEITMSSICVSLIGRVGPRMILLQGYSYNTSAPELIALKGVLRGWHSELMRRNPGE